MARPEAAARPRWVAIIADPEHPLALRAMPKPSLKQRTTLSPHRARLFPSRRAAEAALRKFRPSPRCRTSVLRVEPEACRGGRGERLPARWNPLLLPLG